jgi:hypothetical protein
VYFFALGVAAVVKRLQPNFDLIMRSEPILPIRQGLYKVGSMLLPTVGGIYTLSISSEQNVGKLVRRD